MRGARSPDSSTPVSPHQTEHAGGKYAPQQRMESLDSIRGLAALAVLLGHTLATFDFPVRWCRLPLVDMMFNGRSAVTMFFILSGFVLARPYLVPPAPGQAFRRLFIFTFYLRRITRIWIPWFFAFVLSVLARIYFFRPYPTIPTSSEWRDGFWHIPLSIRSFLLQCVFQLHDARQLLLPQDWSLGVELKGSILIPLFLLLVRKNIWALFFLCLIFLLVTSTGAYYVSFALGVITAKYYHQYESRLRALPLISKCVILGVGVLLYESRLAASYVWDVRGIVDKIVWCIASVGCVLILAASLSSRRIQSKLNLPIFLYLGKISFSLYLLQFIVMLCVLPPLVRVVNMVGIYQLPVVLVLTLVASVLITATAASTMYQAIEKPSMQLGRWLTKKIQNNRD